jgi:hypothetical protein
MDPAIGPVAAPPQAAPAAAPGTAPALAPPDDTAEVPLDRVSSYADAVARRSELFLLATQARQQDQQARLDRMRANFNESQERRSERLREMNALRDMAIEQAKKDDEVLKKYIAMI